MRRVAYEGYVPYAAPVRKALSLLLAVLFALSPLDPLFSLLGLRVKAQEYITASLDGSGGNLKTDWYVSDTSSSLFNPDGRYDAYAAAGDFVLGSAQTPYIIKTGDDLAGLSSLVNNGTDSFAGKYVDIQGWSQQEASGSGYTPRLVDLRMYFSAASSSDEKKRWIPIGEKSTAPFQGTLFSSVQAEIRNFMYGEDYMADNTASAKVYGLVNYNQGTIGVTPSGTDGGFRLTFTEVASMEGQEVQLTVTHTSVSAVGGVAAVNLSGGTIANVRVSGELNLPAFPSSNANALLAAGGVVGSNQGTLKGCSFFGKVTSGGMLKDSTEAALDGIGGIAGFSQGVVSYCISNADVAIGAMDAYGAGNWIKAGGVVGKQGGGSISNCVFSGSVKGNAGTSKNTSCFGGIAGYLGNNIALTKCVSSAVIDRYSENDNGGAGSIAGYATGPISYSLGMGTVTAGDCGGGLVGFINKSLTYSYYTGAVKSYGVTSSNRVGGLAGRLEGALQHSYFAGSTLSSQIGSVAHTTNQAAFTDSYYDRVLSPNNAESGNKLTADNYGKTTQELFAAFAGDSTNWVTSADCYPQLAWTANVDSDASAPEPYRTVVKALAAVSVSAYVTVSASSAYTDSNGLLSAYQMRPGQIQSSLFLSSAPVVDGAAMALGGWTAQTVFQGNYTGETLGSEWGTSVSLTVDSVAFTPVPVVRKLLNAVRREDGKTDLIDAASFYRFLDVSNAASGAFLKYPFQLVEDVAASIPIKPFDSLINQFSANLDGLGHTVTGLSFANNAASLLGLGRVASTLRNLNLSGAVIGTQSAPFQTTGKRLSLLFEDMAAMTISNIAIDNLSMVYPRPQSSVNIGLIAARTSGGSLNGVTISDSSVTLGDYSTSNVSSSFTDSGMMVGNAANSTVITGCGLSNLDILLDVRMMAGYQDAFGGIVGKLVGTVTQCYAQDITINLPKPQGSNYTGGLVGVLNTNGSSVKDSYVYGNITGGNIGGVVAYVNNNITIERCHFYGNIQSADNNTAYNAGGVVGNYSNAGTLDGCSSMGNITSFMVGGLIGQTGNTITVQNSYSKAIVTNFTNAKSFAGGLVGFAGNTAGTNGGNVNIYHSYFAGQIKGGGGKGGLMGYRKPTGTFKVTDSFFDESIAGHSLFATSDKEDLYPQCSVQTGSITAAALNSDKFTAETAGNYPQLAALQAEKPSQSDLSTRKVFLLDEDAFLTSIPVFTLQMENSLYTVEKNTQKVGENPVTLYPWDEILTENNGRYSIKSTGNTTFTVKNIALSPLGATVDMVYDIIVKPFDYGNGTQSDPYIIYSVEELVKFRDFLAAGFDNQGLFYKIGSAEPDTYGQPITLDLSEADGDPSTVDDEWTPIMNLAGQLDGNNSVIQNLTCNQGMQITLEDGSTVTYYGLFGTTTLSARILNLTLNQVHIDGDRYNAMAGALIGQAGGGTYTGVSAYDVHIHINSSAQAVGGLIGSTSGGGVNPLDITDCFAQGDYTGNTNGNCYGGGLIGSASLVTLNISRSAAYGSVTGYYNSGGLIGRQNCETNITDSVSTVDLYQPLASGASLGGIIGLSTSSGLNFRLENVVYGGRMESSLQNQLGGLMSSCKSYVALNTSANPFPSLEAASFLSSSGVTTQFQTDEDVRNFVYEDLQNRVVNCYYNYDVNPYPTASQSLNGRFYYMKGADLSFTEMTYQGQLARAEFGKSNVLAMTEAVGPSGFSSDVWQFTQGLYPRLSVMAFSADDASTARDEGMIDDIVRFYSIAVHYTNAGAFGDDTYANLFVRYTRAGWSAAPDGTPVTPTQNGRMLVSTSQGSRIAMSLNMAGALTGRAFAKDIRYTPSTVACGVPDFSWYFANREGMWITEDSQTVGDTVIRTAYPWTLYTSDQLMGLSLLGGGTLTDGNGLTVDGLVTDVTYPQGMAQGDSFVLGKSLDADVYESFTPIGTRAHPFTGTFNGRGYVIENLHVHTGEDLGLFGSLSNASVQNVGVVSGEIRLQSGVKSAGVIAGQMSGSAINGCFASISITGGADGVAAGGLAGIAQGGGNGVFDSFFTGYILAAGENTVAGGLVGSAAGLSLRSCYVAGYVDAASYEAVAGEAKGGVTVSSVYYDPAACGSIGESLGASSGIPGSSFASSSAWFVSDGLYPIEQVFVDTSVSTGAAAAAVVPVNLTNARSVTSGKVEAAGAQLYYVLSDYPGTVADNSGNVYDDKTPFTSFQKAKTGLAILKVTRGGAQRELVANMQCWYDAGYASKHYVINTARELAEFSAIVNGTLTAANNPNGLHEHGGADDFSGCVVTLGADLDLSAYTDENGLPISFVAAGTSERPFRGTFDGAGHLISNLTISDAASTAHSGLFGVLDGAVVTDLGLNSGRIAGGVLTGSLAAQMRNGSKITNCFSGVTVTEGETVGGLVGRVGPGCEITESFQMGRLTGSRTVGGVAGENQGSITRCFNTGVCVTDSQTAAGISPVNSGTISSCYQASFLSGKTVYAIGPGMVADSCYDGHMMDTDGLTAAGGAADGIVFDDAGLWTTGDNSYPIPNSLAQHASVTMRSAAALAAARIDFGDGKYNEFLSAALPKKLDFTALAVSLAQSSDTLVLDASGSMWNMTSNDSGAVYLTATVTSGGVAASHTYYLVAVITAKIRYKFDFTALISPAKLNTGRHLSASATDTFASSGSRVISTAADYQAFVAYVNGGGETKGVTFTLDYPIDLSGVAGLEPVGTDAHPFEGSFDGRGYAIRNLTMSRSGTAAMFGRVGASGRVYNLQLEEAFVTASKASGDMYLAAVAAVNEGYLFNIGVTGRISAQNMGFAYQTYLGTLAAVNRGKIRGCYFVQSSGVSYGIEHYSRLTDSAGGLIGDNTGTITGCYIVSDMFTSNMNALVGTNGGKTDNIINCYYNNGIESDTPPRFIDYAFDQAPLDGYFVGVTVMRTKEFAAWLSSNLYAGTFEQGYASEFAGQAPAEGETPLNSGFPYLYLTQLAKYDLSYAYPDGLAMMLSIWNLQDDGTDEESGNFLNGILTPYSDSFHYFDFKYFGTIITRNKLRFDMMLIPDNMEYVMSSRVYGKGANLNQDVDKTALALKPDSQNAKDLPNSAKGLYEITAADYASVVKPNLVVVTVKFNLNDSYRPPWGVHRMD